MKIYSRFFVFAGVLVLATAFFVFLGLDGGSASAQTAPPTREPDGGSEFEFLPRDEITDEQRREIQAEIRKNIERLEREGRLPPTRPEVVALSWPVTKAFGVTDFSVDAISNYVDQNLVFGQIQDWNCGSRTYDQPGYNHAGIDIFTTPFPWKKMDFNEAIIVAAAPGTIVDKTDGNSDRNCALGGGNWNAVFVRHSDNSIAWYGHMKNGSPTSKNVGDTVAAGEYLGVVGSSGNSTGPHLHFELYNAAGQLQDPFQGTCNTMNAITWWAAQEPYRVSRVNKLQTHSAGPVITACPAQEITNEKNRFQPGETLVTLAAYRDQLINQQTQYSIIRPDGTNFETWSHTSPGTFNQRFWWWSRQLPVNAPTGVWRFRAVFNGTTYEHTFKVGISSPFDFDGDAKTDLSIYRPAVGEWWYQKSSDLQALGFQFGALTDRIVPGDHTGDGKTDIAVWRPSNGFWYILRSEDFSFYGFPFGMAGDVPVPGDYDGDGKTDAAIFRPSAVLWVINKSSGGVTFQPFGFADDKPVVADYDGDGKSDIAIYRPSVGEWYYQRSSDGFVAGFQFGNSTDKPVQGDYTGDGKADVAIWRPSTGFWYILRSEDFSFYGIPWGLSTDVPAPGDFDGDGKFDASIFRPSNSLWCLNRSTAGVFFQQFGIATDTPVPSAFIP